MEMTAEFGSTPPSNRTPQNAVLDATSFLFGANAQFIEGLYAQYLDDPASVDSAWRAFFDALGEKGLNPTQLGRGPSWRRDAKLALENGEVVSALTGLVAEAAPKQSKAAQSPPQAESKEHAEEEAQKSIRAIQLVRAYRVIGHLEARLDPLSLDKRVDHPQLDPSFYGFHDEGLDQPVFMDGVMGLESATPRQMVDILRRTYCGPIGYEFMHINDPEQKDWLQRRIEGPDKEI